MPVRLRIGDHPLHPALVHFPIGLWFATIPWNLLGWARPDPVWWQLGYWCLALGLLAAVPALITGLVDYLALPSDQAAADTATAHMMVMMSATAAFGASWLLRAQAGAHAAPSVWVLACDVTGVALLAAGGWFGGTLVYRHRVGASGR